MPNQMIPLGMSQQSPILPQDRPTDAPQGQAPQIDEDDVRNCVIRDFENAVKDKEEYGWVEKR